MTPARLGAGDLMQDLVGIGGAPCLDFCNTISSRGAETESDWLRSYDDLIEWAEVTDNLSKVLISGLRAEAVRRPRAASSALAGALALREALYPVACGLLAHRRRDAAALAALSAKLFPLVAKSKLDAASPGPVVPVWAGAAADLQAPLWPVAWSALSLLRGDEMGVLRQCDSGTCTWLFLDRSRNRSRRWCSMEQCGNVMKARRHYRRHHRASDDTRS